MFHHPAALIFSATAALSGLVSSFAMLLVTRLLMGLAEGGVMPISQALISAEIDPARRGLPVAKAVRDGCADRLPGTAFESLIGTCAGT